jgi:predicted GIY-YIG superfamily endonuclease
MKSRWYVYMVRCRDGSLYTGITTDVKKRLLKHNAGTGAKYTRSRGPVKLVWAKAAPSESAARKREAEIKGWKRAEKKSLILRGRRG